MELYLTVHTLPVFFWRKDSEVHGLEDIIEQVANKISAFGLLDGYFLGVV